MRRTPLRVVPWRIAAVDQLPPALVPRPEFDQRMHPQVQVVDGQLGTNIADLLLAGTPHLLHVVEVLFDASTIGKCLEDLLDTGIRIGAEEGVPAMIFLDDHHANDAAYRTVGSQEGLVGFGGLFAVDRALGCLPTTLLPSSFGQTDLVYAILSRSAPTPTRSFSRFRRQVAERRVLAQPADDSHALLQRAFQEWSLGVTAIDDIPDGFPGFSQDRNDPLQCASDGV